MLPGLTMGSVKDLGPKALKKVLQNCEGAHSHGIVDPQFSQASPSLGLSGAIFLNIYIFLFYAFC